MSFYLKTVFSSVKSQRHSDGHLFNEVEVIKSIFFYFLDLVLNRTRSNMSRICTTDLFYSDINKEPLSPV